MDKLGGYFDYAAATPMDPAVVQAIQPFFSDYFYNPSASYLPARQVKTALDEARVGVAQILGARPAEIVFTAGGTEANNLAIRGILEQFPEANAVISAIEHDSVRMPAKRFHISECPVDQKGIVDINQLQSLIDEKTTLVSVMYANNEVGSIQPIRKIAQLLQEIRSRRLKEGNKLPLYFHTDAAQAANYLDLHVHRLGVDLMTLNGGKIYGPKQSGVLYVRGGIELVPLLVGGGQERGLRSGTENIAGSVGFAEALSITTTMQESEIPRLKQLQRQLIRQLIEAIPSAVINGSLKHRLPNNVHVTIPGQDNERLLILLDDADISAAAGSACSASHQEPSHVLTAMGLNTADIRASLRFTMGRFTTEEDIATLVNRLASVLA